MPALLENETVLPQNVSFQTAHSTPPATKSKKNIAHLYLEVKGVLILNFESTTSKCGIQAATPTYCVTRAPLRAESLYLYAM